MDISVTTKGVAVVAWAIAAIVGIALLLRPTEEKRVIAAFEHAAEVMSKPEGESLLVAASRMGSIEDLAAENVRIAVPEQRVNAVFERREAARRFLAVRASCATLSVRFEGINVESIEDGVARATADLLVSGAGAGAFLDGRDTREVSAELVKGADDGKWRFSSVTINEIVER